MLILLCHHSVYANKFNLLLTHLNPNWLAGNKPNVFGFSKMEKCIFVDFI
jgi:hypothetical protein